MPAVTEIFSAAEAPGFSPAKQASYRKWLSPRTTRNRPPELKPLFEAAFAARLNGLRKASEKQIPRGLKPTRDDKSNGLVRRT